jgi:hypothetical protein
MGAGGQVKLDLVSAEKNTLRIEMKELKDRLRDTESSRCAPNPTLPTPAAQVDGIHGGSGRLLCVCVRSSIPQTANARSFSCATPLLIKREQLESWVSARGVYLTCDGHTHG